MYNPSAIARRRCVATRKDGQPCQAWARWADPAQRCAAHSVHHIGPLPTPRRYNFQPAQVPACTCGAYAWPHRPGGGLCRWPEPPVTTCPTPIGQRSDPAGAWPGLRVRQARAAQERLSWGLSLIDE